MIPSTGVVQVICNLTFYTIMYCKMAIIDEVEKDVELGMRFRTPLCEVSIQANMNIDGGSMPAVDYDPMAEDDNTN